MFPLTPKSSSRIRFQVFYKHFSGEWKADNAQFKTEYGARERGRVVAIAKALNGQIAIQKVEV